MPRRLLVLSSMVALLVACDDVPTECVLGWRAQLLPHGPAELKGVVDLPLVPAGEPSTRRAFFYNGGCEPLQIDLDSVVIEGPDAADFTVASILPASGRVISRRILEIEITASSTERGVRLATLSFESNAENFPIYELELVAPFAENPIPAVPDIAVMEDPVSVEPHYSGRRLQAIMPTAAVRFYNLGGGALRVANYRVADTESFRIVAGTANPSAPCIYSHPCPPWGGSPGVCCEAGLRCRCLYFEPNGITCGDFVETFDVVTDPVTCVEQTECDPYGWICNIGLGLCEATCIEDSDCNFGQACSGGACLELAQQCALVHFVSGQYGVVLVELAENAASGYHQTTFEIASNDPDEPVVSVVVRGTK